MQKLTITASKDPSVPLTDRARDYIQASRAHNTMRAYKAALIDFRVFCDARAAEPLPASVQTVVDYLTFLADGGQGVSTIQVKLSAIAFAHRAAGLQDPTQAEHVRVLMQGIRRRLGTAPDQKTPVQREELVAMITSLPTDLRGVRNRAILLLGFAGAFRRSELVALRVEDVRFLAREMIVTVTRSKTDQEGQGVKKHIPILDDPTLCPVRALKAWLQQSGVESGPLFRAIDRWGHVRRSQMSDRDIALFVKQATARVGLESREFAGHSLRAGFVTQAAKDGTPEWQIQEVTGHKSVPVLRRYIRDAGLGQTEAIRRAFGEMGD